MITAKQAARLRHKLKTVGKLSPANVRKLEEYESAKGNNVQQPPGETQGGGDVGNQDVHFPSSPHPDPASPADLPDPMPPPPGVEAPPPVREAPPQAATSAAVKGAGDWRNKWREQVHFSGDGRQMLCESIGLSIVEGLGALRDETAKVTAPKTPDPKLLAGMFVLAMDDLLPDRARLTPKIGAAAITVGTIVERYYHADAIKEFLKNDPEHIAWMKKQAERERNEQAARADREAELKKNAEPAKPEASAAKFAEPPKPPPPPATPKNGTAVLVRPEPRKVPLAEDPDALF